MRRRGGHDWMRGFQFGGFADFVRSLLSGIPWSERAEIEETLTLEAPEGGVVRLHNPNGRTHVHGEDRGDILVHACKRARAESTEAAEALLDEIRVASSEVGDVLELEVEVPRRGRGFARWGCGAVPRPPRAPRA